MIYRSIIDIKVSKMDFTLSWRYYFYASKTKFNRLEYDSIIVGGSYSKKLTKLSSICSVLVDENVEINLDYMGAAENSKS